MRNLNTFMIVLILIIFVAIFTNPSTAEHKEAVKFLMNKNIQKSVSKSNSNDFEQLGAILGNSLAGGLIENSISRDNYLVFSITMATWNGKSKKIGYGCFGNVYISKDISAALLDD